MSPTECSLLTLWRGDLVSQGGQGRPERLGSVRTQGKVGQRSGGWWPWRPRGVLSTLVIGGRQTQVGGLAVPPGIQAAQGYLKSIRWMCQTSESGMNKASFLPQGTEGAGAGSQQSTEESTGQQHCGGDRRGHRGEASPTWALGWGWPGKAPRSSLFGVLLIESIG